MILKEYEDTRVKDPIEMRRGNALWIFDPPAHNKNYIISADTARGDGQDYSAFQILDLDTLEQVAEYQDQLIPADYGDLLVTLATEYNDALLVVERTGGLGYAALQQIINRGYKNTFYSSSDLKIIDIHRQYSNSHNREDRKLLPGFETTTATRPLIISKLDTYFREKSVGVKSIRTINELRTFIWENGKAQAAKNYNDDLVMSLGFGLWIRDMALKLRQQGILLTKMTLDKFHVEHQEASPIYTRNQTSNAQSQWQMRTGGKPGDVESLTWLLR